MHVPPQWRLSFPMGIEPLLSVNCGRPVKSIWILAVEISKGFLSLSPKTLWFDIKNWWKNRCRKMDKNRCRQGTQRSSYYQRYKMFLHKNFLHKSTIIAFRKMSTSFVLCFYPFFLFMRGDLITFCFDWKYSVGGTFRGENTCRTLSTNRNADTITQGLSAKKNWDKKSKNRHIPVC